MDEIALHAGITKRTLYKHFRSKIVLYMEMFDYYLDRYYAGVVEAAQSALPADQVLLKIFDAIYMFTKQNQKFMLLYWMLDTNEYEGEIPQEVLDRVNRRNVTGIQAAIDAVIRAQNEGLIINFPAETLVHTISAINKGIFFHTHKERKFGIAVIDSDTIYQNAVRLLKEGLFIKKADSY